MNTIINFATINTKSSEWPINCLLLHQHCLSLFRYKSGDCIGDSQVSTPTWLLTFFVWSQGRSLMSSCLKPGIRLIFHEFHKCCIIFPRCYLMWKPFGVFVDALLHSIFCIVFLYSLQPAFFNTVQKSKSCHAHTSRYAWNKMWFSVFCRFVPTTCHCILLVVHGGHQGSHKYEVQFIVGHDVRLSPHLLMMM